MSVDPKTQSLFDAILAVNYDRVKLIINSGVAINHPNHLGQTPLAVAYHRGNLEIVDLLIAAGARMQVQQQSIGALPSIVDRQTGKGDLAKSVMENRELALDRTIDLMYSPIENDPSDIQQSIPIEQACRKVGEDRRASWQDIGFDARDLKMMATSPNSISEPEKFLTVDLDEVFAAEQTFDSPTMVTDEDRFIDEELTKPYLPIEPADVEVEGCETYVFDLSQDLDRLTAKASQDIDDLSMPMGEWEAHETYVMELDTFDSHIPVINSVEVNALEEKLLESLVQSSPQQDAGGSPAQIQALMNSEMLEQIARFDNLSLVDESTFMPAETWAETETYAIEIDNLSLTQAMAGINGDVRSPQHLLADLDSSLFPVIGGEEESDYDLDTENSGDLRDYRDRQSDDLMATYDPSMTNTSLMAAVIDGDLDLVKQSIEAGVNLDCYDWNLSYAPLGMAIDRSYVAIVECLLMAGANPHCGNTTITALGLAAERGEVEIIQLLLARRVDVNTPVGADGWTALLSAIENGHRAVVRVLVTAGANVNVWSRGETPILLAAKCEEREIYHYLYPLVNTAIRLCADRDGEQLLQASQKRRIRQQNRPIEKFIEMATIGNQEEVKRAIEIGIEIDALGAKGHNALMVAAYYGHRSIVKLLLSAGADPSLLSDDDGLGSGMTALMLAAGSFFASNRQQVVKLLITGSADPNQRGVGGKTAIFYAALAGSGYADCVEILIAAGANLDLRDDRGYTVLTAVAAAENYPMLNLLMQAGASTVGLESIQLIQAAGAGNLDRVRSLLSGKVNLNFDRGAAIGNASAAGHTEIVALLIQAGANVNLRDKLGFTPIASAAYLGYGEIVNLLIAAGADIQAPAGESQSYSVLEYAQMGLYRSISPAEKFDRRNRLAAIAEDDAIEPLISHQRDNLQHALIVRQLEQLGAH
jgi:ankyrin repeat protein